MVRSLKRMGLFAIACAVAPWVVAGSGMVKGTKVRVTKEAPLFFQNQPRGQATVGEVYTVLQVHEAAKLVYVSGRDESGKEIALKIASDAVALIPRFAEDRAALLQAASEPYLLNGKLTPYHADREAALAKARDSGDAEAAAFARALLLRDDTNGLSEKSDVEMGRALEDLKGEIAAMPRTAFEGVLKEKLFGLESDPAEQAGDVMRPVLRAKGQRFYLKCVRAELANAARASLRKMAESSEAGAVDLSPSLALWTAVENRELFVGVQNRSAFPLNHCAIVASRVQDVERASQLNADRAIAAGLGAFLGMKEADNRLNDAVGVLEIQTLSMEQGGAIYLPQLAPGASAVFSVSSVEGLNFTQTVKVALWCDEGVLSDREPLNLAKTLEPYAGKAQPGYFFGQSNGGNNSAKEQVRPGIRPSPFSPPKSRGGSGTRLQPSTGLEPSRGL